MKLLFCGDVVGRAGRDAVLKWVPQLKGELQLDSVIISVDNAAGGFGISGDICKQFKELGITAMTAGDHVWDQKEALSLVEKEPILLRPHNFPERTPGTGCKEFTLKNGQKILVLHLLGQVFHMDYLNSPFEAADKALENYKLGKNIDAIFVDMHAEATSEKNAMGVYLDGRVSAVIGSHTHVPTNDCRILREGTAYQTDAGMCGDYDNTVIGFKQDAPMSIFTTKRRKQRMEPGRNEGTLAGTFIEIDDTTGLATHIEPIFRGGVLG